MEFKAISSIVEQTFIEIQRRIRRLQSGGTIDSLKNIGADVSKHIGASYPSLKALAMHYERNEDIALLLWNTDRREEQIISCMLLPMDLSVEKISQLMVSCENQEIATYMGTIYISQHISFREFIDEWLVSDSAIMQNTSLAAISRYLILHKDIDDGERTYLKSLFLRQFSDKYVAKMAKLYSI